MPPGWMMPIEDVIKLVRDAPPRDAVRLLTTLPPDRFLPVLSGITNAEIVHMLLGVGPEARAHLMMRLPRRQLTELIRSLPQQQSAALLSALSTKRILAVVKNLSMPETSVLVEAMTPEQQSSLLAAMEPYQAHTLLSIMYGRGIGRVLSRTNIRVSPLGAEPTAAFLVEFSGRQIMVTVHYLTHGEFSVHELQRAEEAARQSRVTGLLVVTNARIPMEVTGYIHDALQWGRYVDAVTWVDPGHNGTLLRALVGLVR